MTFDPELFQSCVRVTHPTKRPRHLPVTLRPPFRPHRMLRGASEQVLVAQSRVVEVEHHTLERTVQEVVRFRIFARQLHTMLLGLQQPQAQDLWVDTR